MAILMGPDNSFLRPAQYFVTATKKTSSRNNAGNCILFEIDHKFMSQWQKSILHAETNPVQM